MTAPNGLPTSTATRLRRPSWRDPRLAVGVVLVAGSVAVGSWAVSSAEASTPVYVARAVLTPGQAVRPADLSVAEVRLSDADRSHYLEASAPPPADLTAVRVIGQGELIPRSALGRASTLGLRPVALSLDDPGDAVVKGALVDLWSVPDQTGPTPREPAVLVEGLTVSQVASPSGAFASGQSVVHVLVPTNRLAKVLAATAGEGTVRVVPVLGGR